MAVTVNIPIENAVTDGSLNPVTSNAVFDGLAGKASGTGTANGTNTGDETTNTIKTKLGTASGTTDGYLLQADWTTFNGKQATLVSGTNIKTINSTTLLGSGDIVTPHLGNSDLTSTVNTRKFILNGSTSANTFEVWNGARAILKVNGAGDVFNKGAGGVTNNTFFGENVGRNTTGDGNTFFGVNVGRMHTTGTNNSFFGRDAGFSSVSASDNSFFGRSAGQNTTGSSNSFFGTSSGQNTSTGVSNTFIGVSSGANNTTGSSSVLIGRDSGRFIADGVTALTSLSDSVFIGNGTKANSNSEVNQIVIGFNAIGNGSNTATIGNTSITDTFIRGSVICGNTVALATTATTGFLYAPSCAGIPTGVPTARTGKIPFVVDATNNKAYIYSGGAWVALN